MLGDILLIRDMHKAAAEAIGRQVLKAREENGRSYKFIIAISGESGAGKSELSHSLAQYLKKQKVRVKVLHADNYYKVPPLLRTEWRKTKGIQSVGHNEYDWNLIHRNIQDFKEERESMMPCIDIIPEQVDKLITDFKKIDMLIIDGLYALKADGIDLRVFIDLTYHETKISQIVRGKENMDEFRLKVLEREHQNVSALRGMSDLIIDKSYTVVNAKTGEAV